MADKIAGYDGGNMVVTKNDAGKPNGIMIMDTDSQATAKKVLWLNLNGITYSSNGVGGPYSAVWSFAEGGFVADWIVAGVLQGVKVIAESGTIGGWNISKTAIYKDVTTDNGETYRVYFQPPIKDNPDKTWVLSCQQKKNPHRRLLQRQQIIIQIQRFLLVLLCHRLYHRKDPVIDLRSTYRIDIFPCDHRSIHGIT